jgi:predicted DNA-binding transcriptional regulator AlpA
VEGYLTVAQVASRAEVHTGSVYRWLDDPDVPLTRHKDGSGRVWIPEAEADAWIATRNTLTVVPAAAPAATGVTS